MTRRTVVHESDWTQITRQGVVSELNDKVVKVKGVKKCSEQIQHIENKLRSVVSSKEKTRVSVHILYWIRSY